MLDDYAIAWPLHWFFLYCKNDKLNSVHFLCFVKFTETGRLVKSSQNIALFGNDAIQWSLIYGTITNSSELF